MPHKLEIWVRFDQPTKYSTLLKDMEIVRAMDTTCKINIKNRGEEKFPGGIIDLLKIVYGGHVTDHLIENTIIKSLEKNEVQTITTSIRANEEGWAWLQLSISTADKQSVQYFQTPNPHEAPLERWQNGIVVLSRELLEIISSLRILDEKLNKKETPYKKVRKSKRKHE